MKNAVTPLLILIEILLFAFISNAQISTGEIPTSWKSDKIPENYLTLQLPKVDVASLKLEDEEDAKYKDLPLRFAYGHWVNYTPENSGSWFELPNGDRIWRLQLRSEDALSMNVTFSNYHIPEGGKVFIYSSDRNYSLGAFTHLNNKETRYLGTTPIPGDEIVIEYYEPVEVAFEASLQIETVAHAYRDIFKIAKHVSQNKGFGDSGNCNNNVSCPEAEDWEAEIRSVAMITLGNGTRLCSGALINNATYDGTPYFLTANHCLIGSVASWVFVFNYFSEECDPGGNGVDGSLAQSISGATLLANTNSNASEGSTSPLQTDMALLLLSETPPEAYEVFYSGWDWSGDIPSSAVGIHHPAGDVMKISWDNDPLVRSGYLDHNDNNGGNTHWHINDWEDGTTEGGSSGSPLFNEDHKIIGQLHGGLASCSNNVDDYYGALAHSFQYIAEWLDPNETGVTSIEGWEQGDFISDPGIESIEGIDEGLCGENEILPIITIKNYGQGELTALAIDYSLDGEVIGTYNWTGSLLNGESESISLDAIAVSSEGDHIFEAEIDFPGDQNPNNNIRNVEFYIIQEGLFMTLNLTTDDYGSETTWSVFTLEGNEIASGGPYPNDLMELYTYSICIPDTCVEFVIYDSYGDGICCGFGEGNYSIAINDETLVTGGEFDDVEATVVCPPILNSIEDVNPLKQIQVFPNPVSSELNLVLDELPLDGISIHLLNLLGQEVLSIKKNTAEKRIRLELNDVTSGSYILRMESGDLQHSMHIVVE